MTTEPLTRLVRNLKQSLDAADLAELADAELLAKFRETREPAVLEVIVRRHGQRVLDACRRVLPERADADDAFQATFVLLLRRTASLRNIRALGPWLAGVAHRVALQARTARERRERIEAKARVREEPGPDLSWREACLILHEELDRLPDATRLPLVLCYLDGLSRDEAAGQLRRSLGSVKKSLEKGRETLRKRLAKRGVTLSAGLLAAVAEPASADPVEVSRTTVEGIVRPSVSVLTLARSVGQSAVWTRGAAACVAMSALAVGLAMGFPSSSQPDALPPLAVAAAQETPAQSSPQPKAPANEPPSKAPANDPPAKEGANAERIAFAGRVLNPDGQPVKGATVFIAGWSQRYPGKEAEPRTLATTGADGRFEFDVPANRLGLEPEPHLIATANGFGMAVQPIVRPLPKEVTLKLATDFRLHGRVVDSANRPVVGARVRVVEVRVADNDDLAKAFDEIANVGWFKYSTSDQAGPMSRRFRCWYDPCPGLPEVVETDLAGGFIVTGMGVDRLATLLVEGTRLATTEVTVLTRSQEAELAGIRRDRDNFTVQVAAGREVSGKVTDKATGQPIAGIRVHLWVDESRREPGIRVAPRAVTDRNGRYRLDGLPLQTSSVRGINYLRAESDGAEPYFTLSKRLPDPPSAPRKGELTPARDSEFDFQLTRGEWLSGRVVEARTNKPVASMPISYVEASKPGEKFAESEHRSLAAAGVTGWDGRFRIVAPPGRGWVLVGNELFGARAYFSAGERDVQGEVAERTALTDPTLAIKDNDLRWRYAVAAVTVDPARKVTPTITLEPGIQPELRFIDPDGKPLRGVVTHNSLVHGSEPMPEIIRMRQKVNPERPRRITVFHPERKIAIGYLPKAGDSGPWTIQLQPLATVTARLVRSNGEPIANEAVYVDSIFGDGIQLSPQNWKYKTDKDGRVRFTGIVGDTEHSLYCGHLAFEINDPRWRSFTAKPGETKDLGTIKAHPPRK